MNITSIERTVSKNGGSMQVTVRVEHEGKRNTYSAMPVLTQIDEPSEEYLSNVEAIAVKELVPEIAEFFNVPRPTVGYAVADFYIRQAEGRA